MANITEIKRFGEHKNAFGALRLLFASLVILAHTPEMIDGNRSRELLTRIFGTISFGELAVDAFFVISGFLITDSFVKNPDVRSYLLKRVARIFPAFIMATLLCLFVVSPLGGGRVPQGFSDLAKSTVHLLLLMPPDPTQHLGPFPGGPYPLLNGAAWTIAYEFRCYLLVLLLGMLGIFKRPRLLIAVTVLMFAAYALVPSQSFAKFDAVLPAHFYWWGSTRQACRLFGVFLTGSLFFLYRERIAFTNPLALITTPLLLLSLCVPTLADAGTAVFGGYLIFFVAQRGGDTILRDINNKNDISYGIYLYGWPIGRLLVWWLPGASLVALNTVTLALAALFGWLSWHLIEKPVMKIVRHRRNGADSTRDQSDKLHRQ